MTSLSLIAQADEPFIRWDWVGRNLDSLWDATVEHVILTAIAVGVGLCLSLALSMVALRWRKTYTRFIVRRPSGSSREVQRMVECTFWALLHCEMPWPGSKKDRV